jgi:hypothetical protein
MVVKVNWDNFKAKFSENRQYNFEWFCYLLFSKEYNQPYGTHRYTNQKAIETFTLKVDNDVIGWQSKFYEGSLSTHKDDILGTLVGAKEAYPNITKIIFYTNSEFGDGLKKNNYVPKAQSEAEEKAEELGIKLVWMFKSNFEVYCQEERNINISRYFFELDSKWELSNYGFIDIMRCRYLKDFESAYNIIKESNFELYTRVSDIYENKKKIELKNINKEFDKFIFFIKTHEERTLFNKYIAYRWAKNELYQGFEYLIFLSLKNWTENTGLKGLIRNNYFSLDEKNIYLNIEDNREKILFLFNDFDNISRKEQEKLKRELDLNNVKYYVCVALENNNLMKKLPFNKSFDLCFSKSNEIINKKDNTTFTIEVFNYFQNYYTSYSNTRVFKDRKIYSKEIEEDISFDIVIDMDVGYS